MGSYKNRVDAERGGRPVKAANRRARAASIKRQNQEFQLFQETRTAKPLYPREQMKRLDFRLGVGQGAKKERMKLQKLAAKSVA